MKGGRFIGTVSSGISTRFRKNVTLLKYKLHALNMESCKDNNKHMFEFLYQRSIYILDSCLSFPFPKQSWSMNIKFGVAF